MATTKLSRPRTTEGRLFRDLMRRKDTEPPTFILGPPEWLTYETGVSARIDELIRAVKRLPAGHPVAFWGRSVGEGWAPPIRERFELAECAVCGVPVWLAVRFHEAILAQHRRLHITCATHV